MPVFMYEIGESDKVAQGFGNYRSARDSVVQRSHTQVAFRYGIKAYRRVYCTSRDWYLKVDIRAFILNIYT